MMQAGIQLKLIEEAGRKKVVPAKHPKQGRTLKMRGEILTLSANEAVEVGLAKGICKKLHDAHKPLGLKDWQEGRVDARALVQSWKKKMARDISQIKIAAQRADDYLKQAASNHPLRFRHHDRRQRRVQADKCIKYLNLADSNLVMAQRIIDRNPELGLSKVGLTAMRRRIRGYKQQIEAIKNRR